MIQRPFDLNVSQNELDAANIWWRSLSINQMKELEYRHCPMRAKPVTSGRAIHQMWEEEGKPAPQELIPVV